MNIAHSPMFPYIVALAGVVLLFVIGGMVWYAIKKSNDEISYEKQLAELLEDDGMTGSSSTKITLISRWNTHWQKTFQGAGVKKYESDEKGPGRVVFMAALAVAVLASVLTMNPIIGPVLAAVGVWITSTVMRSRAAKKTERLGVQIPGFLFALKANLQAADTNERAMLKVVDSLPSPLYDDLLIVKNRLLANGTFREALEELSEKTASRDLKFLCACMIQAAISGSNMSKQIDNIQKVLTSRQEVTDRVNSAMKSAQPAIYLSSAMIPLIFIANYTMDPQAKSFWFVEPLSWAAIVVTLGLYALGIVMVKTAVDKIRNM